MPADANGSRRGAVLARQLYLAGQADFQKVLESERTLLSVENGVITAQGGGWEAGGEPG